MRRTPLTLLAMLVSVAVGLCVASTAVAGLYTPVITSVTPSSGPTAGGTTVTVRGTGLYGASSQVVRFGGVEATSMRIIQYGTEYEVVTPPHAAGQVDVDYYEDGRTPPVIASLAGGFTYVAPATAPTITTVSPARGPTTGGTSVTITGTNFTGATAVSFGGSAAASFTVNSATSITAATPARAAGAVNVTVTTPEGTGTSAGAFTFVVYRTLTVKNIAGLMARGDARYGATQSDTGAFTTVGTPSGNRPVRNSGYAGGIYCGTRTAPFRVEGYRSAIGLAAWVPEISDGTSCAVAYPTGTEVTLTARPSSSIVGVFGYLLGVPLVDGAGWLSGWGGACKGTSDMTCTVTMDANRSVNVAFSGSGLNLDAASSGGRTVLFNASVGDPETGLITSFDLGWQNSSPSSASPPPGFLSFTTEIVGGSASARENSGAARPVVCRKRTAMVRWKGRVTCQVTPALARRLAQGPVRLRTTVTLKLKGRADVLTVGRRTTVLRNAPGARVTG